MRLSQTKRRRLFWVAVLILLALGIGLEAKAEMRPAPGGNEEDLIRSMDLSRLDLLLDDIAQLTNVARPESPLGTGFGPEQLSEHFDWTKRNFLLLRVSACRKGVAEACLHADKEISGIGELENDVESLWSGLCARAPAHTDRKLCETE